MLSLCQVSASSPAQTPSGCWNEISLPSEPARLNSVTLLEEETGARQRIYCALKHRDQPLIGDRCGQFPESNTLNAREALECGDKLRPNIPIGACCEKFCQRLPWVAFNKKLALICETYRGLRCQRSMLFNRPLRQPNAGPGSAYPMLSPQKLFQRIALR